jgi:hypothetical protein
VLELCNDSREAVLPITQSHSVLFQLSLDAQMTFDGEAHAPNDDYDGNCNQYKKQGNELISQIGNVERKAGRQYEERRRADAKHEAKKTCTNPAGKRYDYDRRKECDVLNALDIRIDGEP